MYKYLGRPRHLISVVILGTVLAAAAGTFQALGASSDSSSDQSQPEPDLRTLHGRALVEEACSGCHGMDGVSEDPETPNLAGQKASYLREQLYLYRSGARYAESMTDLMAPISDSQIDELAEFYSRLPAKPDRVTDPAAAQTGARIFLNGFYRAPPCAACHGPRGPRGGPMMGGGMMGGMGMIRINPALVPNLSGQHAPYTIDTLNAYVSGARRNEVMGSISASLSPAARKAVAEYLAGLR